jgi:uncharacterized protein (TIGR02246 family)
LNPEHRQGGQNQRFQSFTRFVRENRMNFNKLIGTMMTLMLSSAAAFAADAHHGDHAAAPATDSHAAAAKEASPKDGQGKDTAAKDAAAQSTDEPAKPAVVKKSRKPARAKPQHKAPTHGTSTEAHGGNDASSADAHANNSTQATPSASEGNGSKRLRVKQRNIAANAAVNQAEANAPSATEAKAGHGAPDAPAANAAHDGHGGHDASTKPADPAPTAKPAAKGGASMPAAIAPKKALVESDAHDSNESHAAPAAAHHDGHAAPAAPSAHAAADTHADSHTAPAKSASAEPSSDYCNPPMKSEVAALFDRWNASLRTGDPKKVAANYAPGSVLLPTVSNRARFTTAEKEDYFTHFLARRPEGTIDDRVIDVDCNSATDAGLYTFRFSDGTTVKARYSFAYRKIGSQWLITSHHSSGMPEKTEVAAEHHSTAAPNHKPAERVEQSSPARGWVRYP